MIPDNQRDKEGRTFNEKQISKQDTLVTKLCMTGRMGNRMLTAITMAGILIVTLTDSMTQEGSRQNCHLFEQTTVNSLGPWTSSTTTTVG